MFVFCFVFFSQDITLEKGSESLSCRFLRCIVKVSLASRDTLYLFCHFSIFYLNFFYQCRCTKFTHNALWKNFEHITVWIYCFSLKKNLQRIVFHIFIISNVDVDKKTLTFWLLESILIFHFFYLWYRINFQPRTMAQTTTIETVTITRPLKVSAIHIFIKIILISIFLFLLILNFHDLLYYGITYTLWTKKQSPAKIKLHRGFFFLFVSLKKKNVPRNFRNKYYKSIRQLIASIYRLEFFHPIPLYSDD